MTNQTGAAASPGTEDFATVWQQTLARLSEGRPAREIAYLRLTRLVGLMQDTAVLAVPYAQTRDMLETELREPVASALAESLGQPVRVAVTVDETLLDDTGVPGDAGDGGAPPAADPARQDGHARASGPAAPRAGLDGARRATETGARDREFWLNPRYTFETFVAGSSNRFAHAASLAVAESPARIYNPLFIYGESGLGKTHLLHAIGHLARNINPGTRVKYVNSEEFTNDFINAIRDERAGSFQRRYREIDILLLDDVQFLQGKEQTVEEFFHTFNTLHNAEKQVVITSDQPPKKLSGFAERLRTRFEMGLLVDVQPPDLETRIAILRKKAAAERMDVPMEVLESIASRVTTNIRELEGALIRVIAFASVSKQEVSLASAAVVLRDSLAGQGVTRIRPDTIKAEVASFFDLTVEDLVGPSRSRTLVTARQMAMYLCRELTDLSLPKIGAEFGGRDHTTVMHAEKKIRNGMMERTAVYEQIAELTNRIRRLAAG